MTTLTQTSEHHSTYQLAMVSASAMIGNGINHRVAVSMNQPNKVSGRTPIDGDSFLAAASAAALH
jgi:hypothetical protein